jgi:hypothetical protein
MRKDPVPSYYPAGRPDCVERMVRAKHGQGFDKRRRVDLAVGQAGFLDTRRLMNASDFSDER